MGFGVGAHLKIWGVVENGSYLEVECSSSRKNKATGNYETDFSSKYVRFCGNAAKCRPMSGQKIKLLNCSVQNCYERDGRRQYLKNPTYVVFEYELVDDNGNTAPPSSSLAYTPLAYSSNPNFEQFAAPTDDDLPF